MSTDTRHHVHALIDQLPPIQLAALETILQSMLDPVSRKLALAPPETSLLRKATAVPWQRPMSGVNTTCPLLWKLFLPILA